MKSFQSFVILLITLFYFYFRSSSRSSEQTDAQYGLAFHQHSDASIDDGRQDFFDPFICQFIIISRATPAAIRYVI